MSEEHINMLVKLGLSACQARVYLALTCLGTSSARLLSDKSNVARPDVYRVLPILQRMGLVEKELTLPAIYKATPAEEALNILMKQRMGELGQLQTTMKKFVKDLEKNQENICEEKANNFVLFPGDAAFMNRSRETSEKVKKTMETVMPINRVLQAVEFYEETIKRARRRGVAVRLVSENVENEKLLLKLKQTYSETRFVNKKLLVGFTIYDKKELIMLSSPRLPFPKGGGLWSNNSSLVELSQHYFETLWSGCKKTKTSS
jgi:sugar-specific transcriptional regulator TrmB